jgi:hypothetical protein
MAVLELGLITASAVLVKGIRKANDTISVAVAWPSDRFFPWCGGDAGRRGSLFKGLMNSLSNAQELTIFSMVLTSYLTWTAQSRLRAS